MDHLLIAFFVFTYPFVVKCSSEIQKVPSVLCKTGDTSKSVYDYNVTDIWEKEMFSLSKYKGKVILIANVATYCSLMTHYLGLNDLQTEFKDLVILAFPCNNFYLQEPGNNATEILNGIKYIRPGNGFEPKFQMLKKISVNGENEDPLYTYMKAQCIATRDGFVDSKYLYYSPIKNNDVRWNWEKFLVNKDGIPVKRYDAMTHPEEIRPDIQILMNDKLLES